MNEYKILKEIALELLEKYRLSETGLIWEISGSISEDITRLEYECNYMRKQIEKAAEPRWIPVTERLPDEDISVFVYLFGDSPYIAWINRDGEWQTEEFMIDRDYLPKAWMPLPEPYKEENE